MGDAVLEQEDFFYINNLKDIDDGTQVFVNRIKKLIRISDRLQKVRDDIDNQK